MRLLPSPWLGSDAVSLLGGSAMAIGMRQFRNSRGGCVRVFYPADLGGKSKMQRASFFRESHMTAAGYLHVFGGSVLGTWMRKGSFLFWFASLILRFLAWLHPLGRAHIPCCYVDLPPSEGSKKLPLLMWSHGLTGTAEEHGLFAAAMASDGNVVALVHHTDGSSSWSDVEGKEGEAAKEGKRKSVMYEHPASGKDYDPLFRPRQIEVRAEEIADSRDLILGGACGGDIAGMIDGNQCAVGGFSFGAATAAHLAATSPAGTFKCCVLWDGWFHLEIAGNRLDMPAAAHERGLQIPSLFLGSSQFETYTNLADATSRLQGKCKGAEVHVIPHTTHHNFADVVWWLPQRFLRKMGMVGQGCPAGTYASIVRITREFLGKNMA